MMRFKSTPKSYPLISRQELALKQLYRTWVLITLISSILYKIRCSEDFFKYHISSIQKSQHPQRDLTPESYLDIIGCDYRLPNTIKLFSGFAFPTNFDVKTTG